MCNRIRHIVSLPQHLQGQAQHTLGCFDEGVDDDEEGLVGDPESFRTFLSFKGGESGPFSTLGGELASYKITSTAVIAINL